MLENGFNLLMPSEMNMKSRKMFSALAAMQPEDCRVVKELGMVRRRVLVLYGIGEQHRHAFSDAHLRRGGRVCSWDLGYWDRDRSLRVSVDAWHPTKEQLDYTSLKPERKTFVLRDDAEADGPIMLVGIGRKSAMAYGLGAPGEWEQRKLSELRGRYPNRRVLWRPKGSARYLLPGTSICDDVPIQQALRGCSLVVCRHSNVGIDACIAGIPVECEGGAAHALYAANVNPPPVLRMRFLRALSWWNWGNDEAFGAWMFMREMTQL